MRCRAHVGPFESFGGADPFDLVLMLDVLEHLERPAHALASVRALLRPRGIFLLTVPAFLSLWTLHDDLNDHKTRYRRGRLDGLLRAAGLHPLRMRYFFHWVAPAKLAVRAWEAVRKPEPEPPAVPPRPLNRAMLALSHAEQRLPRALRPPFGSSLLAIARRGPDAER